MTKFIDLTIFIISLSIGFLFIYLMGAHKKVVHIYPSPENWEEVIMQDKSKSCYKFAQSNVKCPNSSEITEFPIQH